MLTTYSTFRSAQFYGLVVQHLDKNDKKLVRSICFGQYGTNSCSHIQNGISCHQDKCNRNVIFTDKNIKPFCGVNVTLKEVLEQALLYLFRLKGCDSNYNKLTTTNY